MFSTLVTVALFATLPIQSVFAGFAINNPDLVQCKVSKISWEPATGPYNLIVVKASDQCGDALVDIGDFTNTSIQWKAALKAGQEVVLSLVDSKDNEAWSSKITVGASDDASCLPGATTPPASVAGATTPGSSSGSTTTTTTSGGDGGSSDLTPVGAANAGTLNSAAITARQAGTPFLALAGLLAVVALLQ